MHAAPCAGRTRLAPAARCCAEVHDMTHAAQDVKGLVDLQQLVCAARAPPLLLRLAIVDVPFVLRMQAAGENAVP